MHGGSNRQCGLYQQYDLFLMKNQSYIIHCRCDVSEKCV